MKDRNILIEGNHTQTEVGFVHNVYATFARMIQEGNTTWTLKYSGKDVCGFEPWQVTSEKVLEFMNLYEGDLAQVLNHSSDPGILLDALVHGQNLR